MCQSNVKKISPGHDLKESAPVLTFPFIQVYCDCRLPELYDNLVAYDHGFIISVLVTIRIIVDIGFVTIVTTLKLLSLSLVL